jgi:GWxTD domain-containing protein
MKVFVLALSLWTLGPEVAERTTRPTFRGLGTGTLTLLSVPENVPLEFYTVRCTGAAAGAGIFSVKRSGKDAEPPTAQAGEAYTDVDRLVSFRIDAGETDFAAGDTFSFVTYADPAELDALFDRWLNQYVKWIISREEKERFEELEAPTQKLGFIESFWLRRDKKPETPDNEAREEHQRRFAYATQNFGAGIPGWATDRGKIYILLGPPSAINRNPAGRNSFERPSEVWTYNNVPNPRLAASFDIGFVDFTSTGRFEIVSAENLDILAPLMTNAGWAMSELDAIGLYRDGTTDLVDPISGARTPVFGDSFVTSQFDFQQDLQEVARVPELNLPPLREVTEARADFPSIPLSTEASFFPVDGASAVVPITVLIAYARLTPQPSDDGYLYQADLLATITSESGEELPPIDQRLEVRIEASELEFYRGSYLLYETSLALPPGTYRLEALVRDNPSGALGRVSSSFEVPSLTGEGLRLSSLLVASGAVEMDRLAAGAPRAPFQFGNLRLVPNPTKRFSPGTTLTAYLQAFGFSLAPEDGRARLRVDFFILKDGRLFSKVAPSYHRPAKKDQVAIKSVVSLKALPLGNYTLRARVTDEISGERVERDADFSIDD